VVTTANGQRLGRAGAPLVKEVKASRKERLTRIEGRWSSDVRTWSLEVFVRSTGDAMLKGLVEWK